MKERCIACGQLRPETFGANFARSLLIDKTRRVLRQDGEADDRRRSAQEVPK
jgi:hypothetical protein